MHLALVKVMSVPRSIEKKWMLSPVTSISPLATPEKIGSPPEKHTTCFWDVLGLRIDMGSARRNTTADVSSRISNMTAILTSSLASCEPSSFSSYEFCFRNRTWPFCPHLQMDSSITSIKFPYMSFPVGERLYILPPETETMPYQCDGPFDGFRNA